MSNVKQVIVIRKDLGMRRGKEIAQGSHASMAFITTDWRREDNNTFEITLSEAEVQWLRTGTTKICVVVNSEKELLEIYQKAHAAKVPAYLITDSGATEFNGVPTKTCVAIGPDYADKIDKVTGDLKLY